MKIIYFIIFTILSFNTKTLLAETPLQQENIENIKKAKDILIEVKQLNSDYTAYAIKAGASKPYFLIPIIGTVPAILIAVIHGKKAIKASNSSKEKLDLAIHLITSNPQLNTIKNRLINAKDLTAAYQYLLIDTYDSWYDLKKAQTADNVQVARDLIITDCISDLDDMLSDIRRSDEMTTDKE